MGTNLSDALKKYYRQEGNKFIFKGKTGEELTLNQLAAFMSEVSSVEIDPSTLSRVINNKQLFDEWQLNLLCEVLGKSQEERLNLSLAIAKDLCHRKGFEIDFQLPLPALNLILNNLYRVNHLRVKGDLRFALDMLNDLYEWKGTIGRIDTFSSPPLLKIFGWVDIEKEELASEIEKSRYPSDSIKLVKISDSVRMAFTQGLHKIFSSVMAEYLNRELLMKTLKEMLDAMAEDDPNVAYDLVGRTLYTVGMMYKGTLYTAGEIYKGKKTGASIIQTIYSSYGSQLVGQALGPNRFLQLIHMAQEAGVVTYRINPLTGERDYWTEWDEHTLWTRFTATTKEADAFGTMDILGTSSD